MIKSLLAVAAVSAFSAPVLAGPYVGIDTKSKWTGSDYSSTEFTGKIGYEGKVGTSKYFVEGGLLQQHLIVEKQIQRSLLQLV